MEVCFCLADVPGTGGALRDRAYIQGLQPRGESCSAARSPTRLDPLPETPVPDYASFIEREMPRFKEELFVGRSVADEADETGERIRAAIELVLNGTNPFAAAGEKRPNES